MLSPVTASQPLQEVSYCLLPRMPDHYLENAFQYLQEPLLQEVHPLRHVIIHPHPNVQAVLFHKESPHHQGSTFYFLQDDVRHNHFQFS